MLDRNIEIILQEEMETVSHTGGCHCGAVKFEVIADTAPTSKYQKCYYHKQYFQ